MLGNTRSTAQLRSSVRCKLRSVFDPGSGDSLPPNAVQLVCAGNAAAEEAVARHFSRRVYALALARLHNHELARDMAQDVLLAVILALRAGRLREPDRIDSFVLSTARNLIAGHFRKESRTPALEEVTESMSAPAIEHFLDVEARRRALRTALARLSELDQRILRLNLIEQLRPEQIAGITGLSADSVRQRKSRALRKLGESIERMPSQSPRRVYTLMKDTKDYPG